jgi:hypothetical protein
MYNLATQVQVSTDMNLGSYFQKNKIAVGASPTAFPFKKNYPFFVTLGDQRDAIIFLPDCLYYLSICLVTSECKILKIGQAPNTELGDTGIDPSFWMKELFKSSHVGFLGTGASQIFNGYLSFLFIQTL